MKEWISDKANRIVDAAIVSAIFLMVSDFLGIRILIFVS